MSNAQDGKNARRLRPLFGLNRRIGWARRANRFKPEAMTDQQKWQAVLERDARFQNEFVYAVPSTRVFCRPTCPSKRPKREGVAFFDSAQEAKEAGFRACKRCQPEQPVAVSVERASGLTPRDLNEAAHLQKLKVELRQDQTVLSAGLEAGFGSMRAVYERAPSQLGMTPASYGKGGANTAISFAVAPCELGFVLVARTPVGVCSVALGRDEGELCAQLKNEFFAATIERDDGRLHGEIECVLAALEGRTAFPDLELDVRATAFQWRVWKELQRLKRGETISYSQLAERTGNARAVRAVASACARNPVALVHPCHRVVGKSGSLAGFRWQIERKQKLLQMEAPVEDA